MGVSSGSGLSLDELSADAVAYDPVNSDFDPSLNIETVKQALDNISGIDLKTITEFEAFDSAGLETTTSNGLVTKSGYPITTDVKSLGFYVIDHTATVGNNNNNSESRHQVQWRQGTSGAWTTLVDVSKNYSRGGDAELRSGFVIIELTANSAFQVRIRYSNPGGGTATIEQANIKIGKVSETL